MNISFKQNINHSYMVFEKVRDFSEHHFMMKMLKENEIPGLLTISSESMNGSYNLLYDISSKQAFSRLFELQKMNFEQIRAFLLSLRNLLLTLGEYLLDPDNVVLKQECIFTDPDGMQYSFCYFPYYHGDLILELKELFSKMLTMIDYEDKKAVQLIYELHSEVHNENFTIADMMAAYERTAEELLPLNVMEQSFEDWMEDAEEGGLLKDRISPRNEFFERSVAVEYEEDAGFFEKLRYYLKGKTFMEVLEDINNREIMEKIRQCGRAPLVEAPYHSADVLPLEKKPEFEYISLSDVEFSDRLAEKTAYGETVLLEKTEEHKLVGMKEQQGKVFPVQKIPFTIGKAKAESDAFLDEPTISRLHARIYDGPEGYYLEDLNSLNGTYLNEERLPAYTKAPIAPGDTLRFADKEFCFR